MVGVQIGAKSQIRQRSKTSKMQYNLRAHDMSMRKTPQKHLHSPLDINIDDVISSGTGSRLIGSRTPSMAKDTRYTPIYGAFAGGKCRDTSQSRMSKNQKRAYPICEASLSLSNHLTTPTKPKIEARATPQGTDLPSQDKLNFLVTSSVHKETKVCQHQSGLSTAALLRNVFDSFKVPRQTNARLVYQNRTIPCSEHLSLDKVADFSSDQGTDSTCRQLELEFGASLLGGMHFESSDSDDNVSNVSKNETDRNELIEMSEIKDQRQNNRRGNRRMSVNSNFNRKKTVQEIFRDSQSIDGNTEKLISAMGREERQKYDEYVIKMGFESKLKTYEDAKTIDSNNMKHAAENAFPLPMNQFYSTFVEVQGSKIPTFARYEVHQRVQCTKNYIISKDEESKENDADKGEEGLTTEKPRKLQFKEEDQVLQEQKTTFRSLTFYQYQIKISAFDSIENYLMDEEIVLFPQPWHQEKAIFAGPDEVIWWVRGENKDQLCLYKQGNRAAKGEYHEQIQIGEDSLLLEFWKDGNKWCDEKLAVDKRQIPTALPSMIKVDEERVIIFSRFVFGELPSVCFYSLKLGREFMQCNGTSMLLHMSPRVKTDNSLEEEQSCIFYSNPTFCHQKFEDSQALVEIKKTLDDVKIIYIVKPTMKRQKVNLVQALKGESPTIINVHESYDGLEFEYETIVKEQVEAAQNEKDKEIIRNQTGDWKRLQAQLDQQIVEKKKNPKEVQKALKKMNSDWILCPEMTTGFLFMRMGEFQVQQYQGKKSQFFSIQKEITMVVCEVVSDNEVVAAHSSRVEGGIYIRHDAQAKKFVAYQFLHAKQKWRSYEIAEDTPIQEQKDPELRPMPEVCKDEQGNQMLRRGSGILGVMIDEAIKKEAHREEIDYNSMFRYLSTISSPKWQIQSVYPFHIITNAHQPRYLYLGWSIKEGEQSANYETSMLKDMAIENAPTMFLISFEISNVGKVFYLPEEYDSSDGYQTCLQAFVKGFDPNEPNRLTVLEFRVNEFDWTNIGKERDDLDTMFNVQLRATKTENYRADRHCRHTLKGIKKRANDVAYYCAEKDIEQMHDIPGPTQSPPFQAANDFRYVDTLCLTDNCVLMFGEDPNTKSSFIKDFDHDWQFPIKTERIAQVQRCPHNEQMTNFKDRETYPEFLILDGKAKLRKYQIHVDPTDGARVGQITLLSTLDLGRYTNISELLKEVNYTETLILTKLAIIYKDTLYSIKSGEKYKIDFKESLEFSEEMSQIRTQQSQVRSQVSQIQNQQLLQIEEEKGDGSQVKTKAKKVSESQVTQAEQKQNYTVEFSRRIPFSDKILVGIRQGEKEKAMLRVVIMNEPSSRSMNPFGLGRGFGLPTINRVIPISDDLFLVQATKKSGIKDNGQEYEHSDSYWFQAEETSIMKLDEALYRKLCEKDWTRVKRCKTKAGFCKLSLQYLEMDEDGKVKQDNREDWILHISSRGQLFFIKGVKEPKSEMGSKKKESNSIQEELLINYTDRELMIIVEKKDEKKSQARQKSQEESKGDNQQTDAHNIEFKKDDPEFKGVDSLRLVSDYPLQFSMLGDRLFYSKMANSEICIFDMKLNQKLPSLDISEFTGKKDNDYLALDEVSPHQLIRTSYQSTLDTKTMLYQSNHLQVITDGWSLVFDCNPQKDPQKEKPLLIQSASVSSELADPDNYVETGLTVFRDGDMVKELPCILQPNQSITVIREQMLVKHDGKKVATIIDDCKTLGLYRTYSKQDLLMIEKIKEDNATSANFDIDVLWARFGKQTIFSVFEQSLDIVESLKLSIELLEIQKQAKNDQFSESEVRLAGILQNLTHIEGEGPNDKKTNVIQEADDDDADEKTKKKKQVDKTDQTAKMTSLFRDQLDQTSLRDLLLKIGWESRAFTSSRVFQTQEDCEDYLKAPTTISIEEFNRCFVETPFTRRITSIPWLDGLKFVTVAKSDIGITEKEILEQIKIAEDNAYGSPLTMTRTINVRMIEMGWFFQGRKNFVSFVKLLMDEKLPPRVYGTTILQGLLDQYWKSTQLTIFLWNFLPFCIFAILSIVHFTMVLDSEGTEAAAEAEASFNLKLSCVIFPFWAYLIINEVRQIHDMEHWYEHFTDSVWNWIDMVNLFLTAFVIVTSFESFAVLPIENLRALAAVGSCALIIKIFDWLRLFERTAFFVLLLTETLIDIQYFITLVFVSLIMFGIPMVILNNSRGEDNQVLDGPFGVWILDMLMNQYMLALGDFNLDGFSQGGQKELCYIYFVLAAFITQLTMLNMLIAIMGDTFERITEQKDVYSIRSKLELMADLSAVMSQEDKVQCEDEFFFLIMPEEDEGADAGDEEWQGTLRTLKKVVKKAALNLKKEVLINTEKLYDQIEDIKLTDEVQQLSFREHVDYVCEKNTISQKHNVNEMDTRFEKLVNEIKKEINNPAVEKVEQKEEQKEE